jgi:peptide/nickel transport system substrate-binding protein
MTSERRTALLAATAILPLVFTTPSLAERVLRLDGAPVGEIDPAKSSDYSGTVMATNIYDTLVYPKKGGPGIEPLLASEWSQDGLNYIFKLRPDVKFHSGNPLTADDVVFSYHRLVAMGQGLSSLFAGRVAKVEAIDPQTVKFTLTAPYAPFLAALTRLAIVDSKTVLAHKAAGPYGEFGDYGSAWVSAHGAGSGAYKVESQNLETETVLVKNPDYFRGFAEKAPDRVRYRYSIEAATLRTLMMRGEHDITDNWLPPEVIRALAQQKGMQLLTESGTTGEYIKLNTRKPPLDDVHCRLALTYAFDYGTNIKVLGINDKVSQGVPANGPIPSSLMGHDDAPPYKQDLPRAKKELAQCKHDPKQSPIEIAWIAEVPARERVALLMQANFEALGFPVKVTRVPWALLTDQVTKPETTPHIVEISVGASTPDPDSLLYNMYSSKVPTTWMSPERLNDPKVDELLEAGRNETDAAKRTEIYRALSARLRELAPTIFAYEQTSVFVARDVVKAPTLSDPSQRYSLDNFNMQFREMSINE